MTELAPGAEFAGYRIEGLIGRGGMGVVYRATQLSLDRVVALKIIVPDLAEDEGFRERFKRESRLAASIEHPNVVPVHEAGEYEGVLYISMRFIEGTDLRQLIRSQGGMDIQRAVRIVSQMGAALDAAHARGLVHRDVKPANILLAGEDHAYLTDFGLTKHVASAGGLTGTGQFVGTLDYIAPEQIQGGAVDARADIYALGCVLYELLAGRAPFVRDSDVAKLWAHMNEAPPPLELAPQLEEVVHRAMAKRPEDRQPSAGDLGRAALAAAEGVTVRQPEHTVAAGEAAPTQTVTSGPHTIGAPPGGTFPGGAAVTQPLPPPPPDQPRRSRVPLIAAIAVGIVLLGVVGALALGGGGDDGTDSSGAPSNVAQTEPAPPPADTEPAAPPASSGGERIPLALVIQTADRYRDYYEDENLIGLEELFTDDFELDQTGRYCTGDTTPADLSRALSEYECQFNDLGLPALRFGRVRAFSSADAAEARARFVLTDSGKPSAKGRIRLQFVPAEDQLKIRRVQVEVQ